MGRRCFLLFALARQKQHAAIIFCERTDVKYCMNSTRRTVQYNTIRTYSTYRTLAQGKKAKKRKKAKQQQKIVTDV